MKFFIFPLKSQSHRRRGIKTKRSKTIIHFCQMFDRIVKNQYGNFESIKIHVNKLGLIIMESEQSTSPVSMCEDIGLRYSRPTTIQFPFYCKLANRIKRKWITNSWLALWTLVLIKLNSWTRLICLVPPQTRSCGFDVFRNFHPLPFYSHDHPFSFGPLILVPDKFRQAVHYTRFFLPPSNSAPFSSIISDSDSAKT